MCSYNTDVRCESLSVKRISLSVYPSLEAGLYPNIVLLQSIAICNKIPYCNIVHQLQYVFAEWALLIASKVEHTLATRRVLLPYIDAHCTHTLQTCQELLPYIDAQ